MPKLIRQKRIFGRTTIHTAPEVFLFLPLVSRSSETIRLNKHLVCSKCFAYAPGLPLQIDRVFMSHYHHPEDGFPNLEEIDAEAQSDDQSSSSSVVRKSPSLYTTGHGVSMRFETEVSILKHKRCTALTTIQEIDKLRHLSQSTILSAQVRRYLQDIVVFLRLERGVSGGVSPYATSQFELLTKWV